MNVAAPVSARDLCDPFYHASIGSPLFDFDAAWWQDIVVHRQRELEAGNMDCDIDMPPSNAQDPSWKITDDMQGVITASPSSADIGDHTYAPAAMATSSSVPPGVKLRKISPNLEDELTVEIPSYSLRDPCSLESSSSMSQSSSALLSPVSPDSRGSKRQSCAENITGPSGFSTKRRRASHDLNPATGINPRQRRFFIDDDEADDEPITLKASKETLEHEDTWEIVQGAWWDVSKGVRWTEWESGTMTSEFSDPERPRGTYRGVEAPGGEEVGPQNAPVICVKVMPPLRQPAPRLPSRAVDGAIEVMEHTARKRPRV